MDAVSKTKLMALLTELNAVDQKLYELLDPEKRYPAQREGWFFLGYHNVLNAVYYEFCGESEEAYYRKFDSYAFGKLKRPIAWYESGSFNKAAKKGPKGYSCFIPDCINDVILSYKLNAKQKLRLLNRMFGDLKKIEEDWQAGQHWYQAV